MVSRTAAIQRPTGWNGDFYRRPLGVPGDSGGLRYEHRQVARFGTGELATSRVAAHQGTRDRTIPAPENPAPRPQCERVAFQIDRHRRQPIDWHAPSDPRLSSASTSRPREWPAGRGNASVSCGSRSASGAGKILPVANQDLARVGPKHRSDVLSPKPERRCCCRKQLDCTILEPGWHYRTNDDKTAFFLGCPLNTGIWVPE